MGLCLCAVPCLLVEGVFFGGVVMDCYVTVRLPPSVFFFSYCSLVLVFFYCLVCVPFPRRRCLLSSPVFVCSFVRPMYDLYIVCNTAVNVHNTICIARMCGKTDSCLVTDPDPIFRWHGTSFMNMIRVSRRVFSFLLFVPSSKNTYSHTRCSCSSQ